jgi:hypothetical protein
MKEKMIEEKENTFFTASTIVDWHEEFVPSKKSEEIEYHSELYY